MKLGPLTARRTPPSRYENPDERYHYLWCALSLGARGIGISLTRTRPISLAHYRRSGEYRRFDYIHTAVWVRHADGSERSIAQRTFELTGVPS